MAMSAAVTKRALAAFVLNDALLIMIVLAPVIPLVLTALLLLTRGSQSGCSPACRRWCPCC
jgi:hypothetical protein